MFRRMVGYRKGSLETPAEFMVRSNSHLKVLRDSLGFESREAACYRYTDFGFGHVVGMAF